MKKSTQLVRHLVPQNRQCCTHATAKAFRKGRSDGKTIREIVQNLTKQDQPADCRINEHLATKRRSKRHTGSDVTLLDLLLINGRAVGVTVPMTVVETLQQFLEQEKGVNTDDNEETDQEVAIVFMTAMMVGMVTIRLFHTAAVTVWEEGFWNQVHGSVTDQTAD